MGKIRIVANAPKGIDGKAMRVRGSDVKVILMTDDCTEIDLTRELSIKALRWTVEVDGRHHYASATLEVSGVEIEADIDDRDLKMPPESNAPMHGEPTVSVPRVCKDILKRPWPDAELEKAVQTRAFYEPPCQSCSWDGNRVVAFCPRHRTPR